jgi:hypothetical protein
MLLVVSCGRNQDTPASAPNAQASAPQNAPQSLAMGGAKSVTRFFVTSRGLGRGADLGGLDGADAHCQALADAEGSGDHIWRAYLSATATVSAPATNARDRIGKGPWYNALGELVAANVEDLHGPASRINKETALTEKGDPVNGAGDNPNAHDLLTGSRADGTAFVANEQLTCANWTSSAKGRAQVGHHDRQGEGSDARSWNSAHPSRGCSQGDLESTGGAGLFYCFAVD